MRLNQGTLVYARTLKLTTPNMTGEDVEKWQQYLGIVDDGVFGPHTDKKTRIMQRELGVKDDGEVGPKTIAAANLPPFAADETTEPGRPLTEPPPLPTLEALVSMFLQATHYTNASRKAKDIRNIVIHTAEIGESLEGAEALARVCASPTARKASWHFAVDANSISQSVKCEDVAWHAPGCNRVSIGIELSGRARQTPEEWNDAFSTSMLDLCTKLVATLCREYNIPPVWVDIEDLRAGKQGLTTHNIVSKAFQQSDHWDPGPHFPFDAFLAKVRTLLGYE